MVVTVLSGNLAFRQLKREQKVVIKWDQKVRKGT